MTNGLQKSLIGINFKIFHHDVMSVHRTERKPIDEGWEAQTRNRKCTVQ